MTEHFLLLHKVNETPSKFTMKDHTHLVHVEKHANICARLGTLLCKCIGGNKMNIGNILEQMLELL